MDKYSLGCGKKFKNIFNNSSCRQKEVLNNCDFICGAADGWGKETLCLSCDKKLRDKWAEEDLKVKDKMKGGNKE